MESWHEKRMSIEKSKLAEIEARISEEDEDYKFSGQSDSDNENNGKKQHKVKKRRDPATEECLQMLRAVGVKKVFRCNLLFVPFLILTDVLS